MGLHLKYCVIFVILVAFGCCEDVSSTTENNGVETTTKKVFVWHRKGVTSTRTPKHTSTIKTRMATPCSTPNDEPAYCIEIRSCTKLKAQLENPAATNFIRASRCGPESEDRKNPKVCCGTLANYKHLIPKNPLPKKCGVQNVSVKGRILGGKEAVIGEYPWMVRLIHKSLSGYRNFGCSGFLISSKFVLTAAHCLDSINVDTVGPVFEVQLGEHNTEADIDCEYSSKNQTNKCADKPQIIRVDQNIVHKKYDRFSNDHHNDIGLVHLKKGARMSDYVKPICLLEKPEEENVEYWISGWGKTENYQASPVKMKLSLPQFPWDDCAQKYRSIDMKIVKSQVCAGGRTGKDSCTGDSGGPLMVYKDGSWMAAGVVSYGLGCGQEGWPGVYTSVPSYFEWIKKQILKISTSPRKPRAHRRKH